MKKTIAFLMALLMILNYCLASAETAVQYMNFTVDQYKAFFDVLAAENGMQYSWGEEALYTYGYPMYYAVNEKGNIYVVVHDNDGIIGIETDVFLTPEYVNDTEFNTEIGHFSGVATLTAYFLQHPDITSDDLQNATEKMSELLLNLANLNLEGAPSAYEQELCEDLVMQLAWQLEEEVCKIYFTILPC